MSRSPISRSPDIQRLQKEGYEVVVSEDHLIVSHVPYVTPEKNVAYGDLISVLTVNGDVTITPADHIAYFRGMTPSNTDGEPLTRVVNASDQVPLTPTITADHTLSSKPEQGYPDYYEKMTAYINMIAGHAQALNPDTTAKTFFVPNEPDDESIFHYSDSASSRAGIAAVTAKLKMGNVAIIGLGGTGSYIFDLLAKTPVRNIHLFDGDRFQQHNAFRAPGAATIDELRAGLYKVDYYLAKYAAMREGLIAHRYAIDEDTVGELSKMDFVFMSLEGGPSKKLIVAQLEALGIPFIDVGLGVQHAGDELRGVLAVTTSTQAQRDHVHNKSRIDFSDTDELNQYSLNIQIADLNALNAALAVIRWKKHCGFYADLEREHYSTYTIDGNHLLNEDQL